MDSSPWLLICSLLVLSMQAGFLCLEAGMTRSKNAISVAAKNLIDFNISFTLFWLIGWGIVSGTDILGIFGLGGTFTGDGSFGSTIQSFIFSALFCSTAATIFSGALAERNTLRSYIYITALSSGIIFPVIAHMSWNPDGLFKSLGFIDFAGSTVVHSTGAWIALAGLIQIGPRLGRYGQDSESWRSHQLSLATLGLFILVIGFMGFNSGTHPGFDDTTQHIILVTLLAVVGASNSGMIWARLRHGHLKFSSLLIAPLSGAVASSAFCPYLSFPGAFMLGAITGLIAIELEILMDKWQLDDVVGAVPAHLGGGISGTVLGLLFVDPQRLAIEHLWASVSIQLLLVLCHGFLVFTAAWSSLKIFARFASLRVDIESETMGLDIKYFLTGHHWGELQAFIDWQRKNDPSLISRAPEHPHSEEGAIAHHYNQLLDTIQLRENALNAALISSEQANKAKSIFLSRISHEFKTPLNAIIGYSEMLRETAKDTEDQEDLYHVIQSAQYINLLVEDCLQLTELEEPDSLETQNIWVHRNTLTDSINQYVELTKLANQNMFQLSLSCEDDELYLDKKRYLEVVMRLLGNAFKFTHNGVVKLSISLEGQRLTTVIEDNGRGLSPLELRNINSPFFQGSRLNSLAGIGIGLSICQRELAALGSSLHIQSQLGRGSKFSFTIDLVEGRKSKQDLKRA